MPFTRIADPAQRAILCALLDEICLAAGIEHDSSDREDVACMVMRFYQRGYHTAEELRAALEEAMQDEKRYG